MSQNISGFHSHDGWFWTRLDDGSVVVTAPGATEGGPMQAHTMSPGEWASVIASMSKGGEMDLRFFAAEAFHASIGEIEIKPTVKP
jgi:hypothetical protein